MLPHRGVSSDSSVLTPVRCPKAWPRRVSACIERAASPGATRPSSPGVKPGAESGANGAPPRGVAGGGPPGGGGGGGGGGGVGGEAAAVTCERRARSASPGVTSPLKMCAWPVEMCSSTLEVPLV